MLEESAGAAAELEDTELVIDDDTAWDAVIEQDAVGLFLEIEFFFGLGRGGDIRPEELWPLCQPGAGGEFQVGGAGDRSSGVHFAFFVQEEEEVRGAADGFGGAQQEESAGVEGIVKDGYAAFLEIGPEVDQDIATADEVQPREGRV